jgi:hypothetical protein
MRSGGELRMKEREKRAGNHLTGTFPESHSPAGGVIGLHSAPAFQEMKDFKLFGSLGVA